MKFILGTKVSMTQTFDDKGLVHPVTILKVSPMTVTRIMTSTKDGYNAVQFGYGEKSGKNTNKAQKGQMNGGSFAGLKEVRVETAPEVKVGDNVGSETFVAGDTVTVSSISKGKGFQGGVKRYGFKGGPRTHGQKHSEREPGSLGGGGRDGGRVAKGKRMAGRMGGDRITTKNLKVVSVTADTILIQGAIPGRRGTLVEVKG
jgi:large subunit ribosomal protein L3